MASSITSSGDMPLAAASAATFLRAVVFLRSPWGPGLRPAPGRLPPRGIADCPLILTIKRRAHDSLRRGLLARGEGGKRRGPLPARAPGRSSGIVSPRRPGSNAAAARPFPLPAIGRRTPGRGRASVQLTRGPEAASSRPALRPAPRQGWGIVCSALWESSSDWFATRSVRPWMVAWSRTISASAAVARWSRCRIRPEMRQPCCAVPSGSGS